VLTLAEIKRTLSAHRNELTERFSVKEIGVFGSFVRGEQSGDSDLDMLVEFEKPVGFFKFLELEEHLELLLGTKIDLVSRKALKPRIGERILQEVVRI